MKAVQRFSDEYLESCRCMTPDQILAFLEDFRRLHGGPAGPSRLISLKVPEGFLRDFRAKADRLATPYQTQITRLMKAWVLGGDRPS